MIEAKIVLTCQIHTKNGDDTWSLEKYKQFEFTVDLMNSDRDQIERFVKHYCDINSDDESKLVYKDHEVLFDEPENIHSAWEYFKAHDTSKSVT